MTKISVPLIEPIGLRTLANFQNNGKVCKTFNIDDWPD